MAVDRLLQLILESPQTLTGALSPPTTAGSFYSTDMKPFFSLAMAWALSLAVNAATVSFSGITSTNSVKTNDLLLVDSALGGTNYVTRTATIATLQSALSIPTVPTGLVSNSVAQSGLLAVDATKTNGVAATFGMVTNALGYFPLTNSFAAITNALGYFPLTNSFGAVTNALGYLPATNSSLGNYVLKAGDTMTGALASPAVDFTTPATITPIDAGTLLDFNAATRFASCTLTGSVTFTASNYAVGKTYTVRIINNQVTNVSVAWPWAKMAGGTVTNFFAGTTNLLQAQCWGTASSDVIATCVQLQ